MDEPTPSFIPKAFLENRERLARLAVRRLNPQLAYVLSVDDILQETFIAAQKRRLFFESRPDAPSPATQLAHEERRALLKHAIGELAPNDREILTFRHFDGLSNQECANALSIEPKAASLAFRAPSIGLVISA